MNIESKEIREKNKTNQLQEKKFALFNVFIVGIIFGFLAKLTDLVPSNIIPGLADIGTYFGLWIFVGTILSAWSWSPELAAINSFVFFNAVVIAYYIFTYVLFGIFTVSYFMLWCIAAVFSSIASYIMWYSRKKGTTAALIAAMPIGFLLTEAFSFIHVLPLHVVQFGFDLLAAIILLIILPTRDKIQQRLKILIFTGIILIIGKLT